MVYHGQGILEEAGIGNNREIRRIVSSQEELLETEGFYAIMILEEQVNTRRKHGKD